MTGLDKRQCKACTQMTVLKSYPFLIQSTRSRCNHQSNGLQHKKLKKFTKSKLKVMQQRNINLRLQTQNITWKQQREHPQSWTKFSASWKEKTTQKPMFSPCHCHWKIFWNFMCFWCRFCPPSLTWWKCQPLENWILHFTQ